MLSKKIAALALVVTVSIGVMVSYHGPSADPARVVGPATPTGAPIPLKSGVTLTSTPGQLVPSTGNNGGDRAKSRGQNEPLESIRHRPSAFPEKILPEIHQYLAEKAPPKVAVRPIAPDPGFAYYEAMGRFEGIKDDAAGIYSLAELVLQRADWLLTQSDTDSHCRAVYLASITASSIQRHAPDPLLTSAIFDVYIYPNLESVPIKAGFSSQTREGVIRNSALLFADLFRDLQFFDLQYQHARNEKDKDVALYQKAYALNGARRTQEALEVWARIRDDGEMGWMKARIANAWKKNLANEQKAATKSAKQPVSK